MGTYTYAYAESNNPATYNDWQYETVETLPNGTVNTTYSNFVGETLLVDQFVPSTDQDWVTDYQYNDYGEIQQIATPSAVTGFSSELAGLDVAISSDEGFVYTAMYTGPEDYGFGYLSSVYVQQGTGGTPQELSQTTYDDDPGSLATVLFVDTQTVFQGDGVDATTSYSYTFYSGTSQIEQETITLPFVSDQPGDTGTETSPDTETIVFNRQDQPVWTQDANGEINYTAYDPDTGAVVEQIQDVNSSTAESLDCPLAVADGTHLNLKTTYKVDLLGRTVEETDPKDNATFFVYYDALHEERIYSGFKDNGDGTYSEDTSSTMPPVQVIFNDLTYSEGGTLDLEGSYTETLSMQMPASDDLASSDFNGVSLPVGGESIANVTALNLAIMNQAGQEIEQEAYFSLPSDLLSDTYLTGSGATSVLAAYGDGSAWSVGSGNFDPTKYQYNDLGELDRVQDADGNITRYVYDGLGRETSIWVGTNDSPYTPLGFDEPTYYWSPGSTESPDWNMVEITAYVYDNGNVGDSDLTEEIQFPGGNSHCDASSFEVTQMAYNFEDQFIATKQGASVEEINSDIPDGATYFTIDGIESAYYVVLTPSAETDGTNRPITYYALDNLGDVTAQYVYAGSGVALSDLTSDLAANPDEPNYDGLLRADTIYSYDAQGRTQEIDVHSVSQSSGDIATGTGSIESTTFVFDDDGNILKVTDPNDVVTNYAYNFAGWLTSTQQTDPVSGGGDGTVTSGHLTTTYAYDSDGNLTSVTDSMGNVTTYAYDASGRETAEFDPDPTTGDYTPTASEGDPGSPEIKYVYDSAGNLESETDPDGNATSYTYDALGRGLSQADELSDTSSYAYDGDGNLLQSTDPDGQVITYAYNDLNQLTNENWFTSTAETDQTNAIAYTYDNLGHMLTAADDFSSYEFSYNVLGQQISSSNDGSGASGTTGTAGVPQVVLDSTYDALGNRKTLDASIGPTGSSVADFQNAYFYDGFGRESQVTQSGASGGSANAVADKLVNFSYNLDNQYTEIDRYDDLTGSSDDSSPRAFLATTRSAG